jgi:M6 family metalloprotease-like protein
MLAAAVMIAAMSAKAQVEMGVRMGCFRPGNVTRADYSHILPKPYVFDSQKIYRQPVVLIEFNDMSFSMADPVGYYNRVFNEAGYNEGAGMGCVADYFRYQSGGLLNLQFDIFGPVKVDESAKKDITNHGDASMRKAVAELCKTEQTDFAIYDWDGDGKVNQVVFVAAGYAGNQMQGYTYPNTCVFLGEMPGGIGTYMSSISCERWKDEKMCGIGTIIHEFSHCLGLPDIYPMRSATAFSTVDEWDLMDGGNYTNYGWCPPNLTAMERMYLGWSSPVELSEPTTIVGMKSLSDGGETYIIRNDSKNDEFYLLENRRQEGWDYGCPGNGLLISYVDFNEKQWRDNEVNISDVHYRYDLFHADGKDYKSWDPENKGKDSSRWTMDGRLRSRYFSTTPYPYTDPESQVVNRSLTDESTPAATLYSYFPGDYKFMGKPITNIQMADDGTISFDFMKGGDTGIRATASQEVENAPATWYTIDGRRLAVPPSVKGLYLQKGKKVVVK